LVLRLTKTFRQYSTGNRPWFTILSMSFCSGSLISSKPVVSCFRVASKNGSAFYLTGTEQGYRTTATVSKAVSMEQNPDGRMVRQLADQSPILGTTITLERLRKRGYEALLTHNEKVAPSVS
jgi:hypothetical protein